MSFLNPLSPNSDQHQFSPNDIHTMSRAKSGRINSGAPRSENSSSFFKSTGGEDLILPWSRVGHALRPIFIR